MTSEVPLGVVYYDRDSRPDEALTGAARRLRVRGLRAEGLIQDPKAGDTSACALLHLADIASGRRVQLFEPRGRQARGCRLDPSGLATAATWLRDAIARRPDVLFVSRFGRQEADGRGLLAEIAEAIVSGIPVVIAVGQAVMPEWREFSAGAGTVIENGADAIERWCVSVSPESSYPQEESAKAPHLLERN